MNSIRIFSLLSMYFLCACASTPPVAPLEVGQQVDFALLQDQYAQPFVHETAMKYLLFTNSMKPGRAVRDVMSQLDPHCYQDGTLVFVADVSGMPKLITKMIAVPKMRGYGFSIWLDYEGEATAALPVKEGSISVIKVDKGAIEDIQYVLTAEELTPLLVPVCGYAKQQMALLSLTEAR